MLSLSFYMCSKEVHVFFPQDHLGHLLNTRIPRPPHHRSVVGPGSESIGNAVLTKDGIEDRTKAFELNASEALSLFSVALTAADPETQFIFRSLDKHRA